MRRFVSALIVSVLVLSATSCGKETAAPAADPMIALQAAADQIAATPGLHITIESLDFPADVRGLVGADGIVVKPASFEGTLTIRVAGADFPVPVVGIDNTLLAEIPLTEGWSDVDAFDYGAPDPTRLLDSATGFGSLLPLTEDVKAGKAVRGGKDNAEVLTTYTGVVSGPLMKAIIPSADGASFDVTYEITDSFQLRTATFVGIFYPQTDPITYIVTFDDYGTTKTISLPQ